ncbi:MAG: hypothetical protein OK457_07100 [Thaumarchaeota archaeon]|nr:hypothetical protein [Nitrososphaerota archaeon]
MSNSQKTISFLSMVNSTLGPINVNFDAETSSQCLDIEAFSGIYDLGLRWSETYQSSTRESLTERSALIRQLLWEFGRRFSANLVLGNIAYGLNPKYKMLQHIALHVAPVSNDQLKLGAEGLTNGMKAIDLAAQTRAFAYLLHTSSVDKLIEYSKERGVKFMVYSLLRIAETRSIAAQELMRLKGTEYFERRGVQRDDAQERLGEFSILGCTEEITDQILSFINRGASKVVLFPVFKNQKDLMKQLNLLSNCLE